MSAALEMMKLTSAFEAALPPYDISITIEHNDHKGVYETVEEYLSGPGAPEFADDEQRQRAIDSNELWTVRWYPRTPIGFNIVGAPSLSEALEFANRYAVAFHAGPTPGTHEIVGINSNQPG